MYYCRSRIQNLFVVDLILILDTWQSPAILRRPDIDTIVRREKDAGSKGTGQGTRSLGLQFLCVVKVSLRHALPGYGTPKAMVGFDSLSVMNTPKKESGPPARL